MSTGSHQDDDGHLLHLQKRPLPADIHRRLPRARWWRSTVWNDHSLRSIVRILAVARLGAVDYMRLVLTIDEVGWVEMRTGRWCACDVLDRSDALPHQQGKWPDQREGRGRVGRACRQSVTAPSGTKWSKWWTTIINQQPLGHQNYQTQG